jgi:dihydroorotate dehydrogenase (NAD+) catalytic subunit
MLLAGASAVQVGTATFADPTAPSNVVAELVKWANQHDFSRFADLRALA